MIYCRLKKFSRFTRSVSGVRKCNRQRRIIIFSLKIEIICSEIFTFVFIVMFLL